MASPATRTDDGATPAMKVEAPVAGAGTPAVGVPGLPALDMTVEDAVKRLTGHDVERIARAFGTSNFEKLDTLTPWVLAWVHLSNADRHVTKGRILELTTEQVTGLFRDVDDAETD